MRPVTAINTLRPRVELAVEIAASAKRSQVIRRAAARQAEGATGSSSPRSSSCARWTSSSDSLREGLLLEAPAQRLELLLRPRRELALDPDLPRLRAQVLLRALADLL